MVVVTLLKLFINTEVTVVINTEVTLLKRPQILKIVLLWYATHLYSISSNIIQYTIMLVHLSEYLLSLSV